MEIKTALESLKALKVELAEKRKTKALNPKLQKTLNAFVKANLNYDMLVNEQELRDELGTNNSPAALDQRLGLAYDLAGDAWEMLPLAERKNLVKSHDYLTLKDY